MGVRIKNLFHNKVATKSVSFSNSAVKHRSADGSVAPAM